MIAAGVGWRMRLEIGAGHAGADANETKGGSVAGFVVEAVVKDDLHHRIRSMVELSGARASMPESIC
jgi:hypothetical protein